MQPPTAPAIAPAALRPQVEGDFANERVKQQIMAQLFAEPAPAARIGRFTVIRELGRGGTGVVYAAYDEQLDRKIAVKLLHGGGDGDARLLREAQAMARLSHPHIVSVHEVGTHGGQIYIAMEFVHGTTLDTWLKGQVRGWREVLEMFRQAASGLAAAHDAGLVHRDFKPQNAMVGSDGRVRVLDFGLARADGSPDLLTNLERTADPNDPPQPLDTSLTITGSLVGTPAFMAPEQFRGEKADARADQFSLCVALYEALYRSRPFAGDSLQALMRSVLAGEVRDPCTPTRLPRALRAAILRGLQLRPESRHPSMHALIAAIDRVLEPPRRRWLFAAVVGTGLAASIAGIAGMVYRGHELAEVCDDRGRADIDAVWNPGRAATIAAALHAMDPRADQSWPLAAARLDRYAEAWQRGTTDACAAGEIRREQSPAFYALRKVCLDDSLRAMKATLELLERPDPILAIRAPDIVAGLTAVDRCADPQTLARHSHADDHAHAGLVAALRVELARADALRRATMHDEALATLDALAARVPAEHAPLQSELALSRGRVLAGMGRHSDAHAALRSAYFTGLRAHHEALAIAAATELISLASEGLADFFAADRWLRHAEALSTHVHAPDIGAHLASAHGRLSLHTGRHLEAQVHFDRALTLFAEANLSDTPEAAVVLRTLADASIGAGQLDRASDQLALASEILRRDYCDAHPERAAAVNSAGKLALARNDLDGALASFERGRNDLDGAVPVDNPVYLQLVCNSATVLMRQGELTRADTLVRDTLGAIARSSEASAKVHRLGPDLYTLRLLLVKLLARQGKGAEAEAEVRRVIADAERNWGADEPYLAHAYHNLADLLLEDGRASEALPHAEHADQLTRSRGDAVPAKLRIQSAFALARVLAVQGDRPRARALALEARGLAEGMADNYMLGKLDAWLAQHPAT